MVLLAWGCAKYYPCKNFNFSFFFFLTKLLLVSDVEMCGNLERPNLMFFPSFYLLRHLDMYYRFNYTYFVRNLISETKNKVINKREEFNVNKL